MNLLSTAWYWKKFYWKMFSTFIITGGGGITMSAESIKHWGTLSNPERFLIVIGFIVLVIKAQDALVDQTFQTLSQGNGNGGNGNGNGSHTPVLTTTQQTIPPTLNK